MDPELVFIQSADPFRYRDMLGVTSRTVIEFARRHGCDYQAFIGLKRGYLPWHATFNRIVQLSELLAREYRGWVFHVDADAFVCDLDFDIAHYLGGKRDRAAVLVPSGATDARWDINAGVAAFNLGSPEGRDIVRMWAEKLEGISDEDFRSMSDWAVGWNDQNLLHSVLEHNPALLETVYLESPDLINSFHARFIRQILRDHAPGFEARLDILRRAIDEIMMDGDGDDIAPPATRELERSIVQALYEAILDRSPDSGGERNAVEHMSRLPLRDGVRWVANGLISCDEFRKRLQAAASA